MHRLALRVLVVAIAVLNLLKGLPADVQSRGWPYYALTYRHGFIRRGLFGTLFQAFAGSLSTDQQQHVALGLHGLVFALFFAGLVRWGLARGLRGATAVFALSTFVPTLLQLAGYLDLYILALAALGAWLVDRGQLRVAAAVAALGPFVHDAFIFVWLPVLVLEARRTPWKKSLPLLAPVVSELAVLAFSSKAAVMQAIDDIPQADFLKGTFELTTGRLLRDMIGKMVSQPGQLAMAIAVILPCAFILIACACRLAPRRAWAFVVLAAVSPTGVLFVAWDLSRFLTWAIFGSFLVLLALARDVSPAPPPRFLPYALAAAAFLATGPHLYLYFEEGYGDYGFLPGFVRSLPSTKLLQEFLLAYNHAHSVRSYSLESPQDVAAGGEFETVLWIRPGRYRATAHASPSCEATLDILVPWRYGVPKVWGPFVNGNAELHFEISTEEAAMARLVPKVWKGACPGLTELRIDAE